MAANEVCISEFSDVISTVRGAEPVAADPPLAVTILALDGTHRETPAFNVATKYVRIVVSGVDARIVNNTLAPVADVATSERWIAGSTEYRGATAGNKCSVVAAT